MQSDPIGYKDSFNLYQYAGNDPANRFDPSGEDDSPYSIAEADRLTREFEKTDPVAAAAAEKKAAIAVGVVALVVVAAPVALGAATATAGEVAVGAATAEASAVEASGIAISEKATAAALVATDGTVATAVSTGAGGAGYMGSAATQELFAALPAALRARIIAGQCAEWGCVAAAMNAGINVEGATMATVRIATKEIVSSCMTCRWLVERLGINVVAP